MFSKTLPRKTKNNISYWTCSDSISPFRGQLSPFGDYWTRPTPFLMIVIEVPQGASELGARGQTLTLGSDKVQLWVQFPHNVRPVLDGPLSHVTLPLSEAKLNMCTHTTRHRHTITSKLKRYFVNHSNENCFTWKTKTARLFLLRCVQHSTHPVVVGQFVCLDFILCSDGGPQARAILPNLFPIVTWSGASWGNRHQVAKQMDEMVRPRRGKNKTRKMDEVFHEVSHTNIWTFKYDLI